MSIPPRVIVKPPPRWRKGPSGWRKDPSAPQPPSPPPPPEPAVRPPMGACSFRRREGVTIKLETAPVEPTLGVMRLIKGGRYHEKPLARAHP
jgi:hypothetical protein